MPNKGYKQSTDHKQKVSKARTGTKRSEATKLKMSEALKDHVGTKGIPQSEEHKRKIRESNLRRYCKYGHDTSKVGRVKSACRFCICLNSAKDRNVPFSLTEDQFADIVNKDCIYKCPECNSTGVDQIIAGQGYVVGNVQPLCGNHNWMKLNFPTSKFETLCSSVRPLLFESSVDLGHCRILAVQNLEQEFFILGLS